MIAQAVYIVAVGLLIYGMSGLAAPRTAVRGNQIAALGVALAVIATVMRKAVWHGTLTPWLIGVGVSLGAAAGIPAALKVRATGLPQMVALFNGLGGAAPAVFAWVAYRHAFGGGFPMTPQAFELFAALVGAVSFSGSSIAFQKLQGILPGRPIKVRGQSWVTIVLLLAAIGCAAMLLAGDHSEAWFLGLLVSAMAFGNLMVLAIGGADMPVVIALLNAFTGLSTAATGVAVASTPMIVAGMIVGASGTTLTLVMAAAMNRSVLSIVTGGFGADGGTTGAAVGDERAGVRTTSASDAAIQLAYARRVVIVPGYGMAHAQAQQTVGALQEALSAKGVTVEFAIHPVAGRMPGHMNTLLAEADVPYDLYKDMAEINPEFPHIDVTLVIGANDVTNPAARDNPKSPIFGMPILEVDRSKSVIVLKRAMGRGYAKVENPLFHNAKTAMLFGDARRSLTDILASLREL